MTENELRDKQLAHLKEAANIFLRPQDKLPFSVVVEAMIGKEILPITKNDCDQGMLNALANSCVSTVANSSSSPFPAARPNEVSFQVENALQEQLECQGVLVESPRSSSGRASSSGYPDRLLWHHETPTYLEVKVSREENMGVGSARNFFFKPSVHSKIEHSARHLLAGFSICEDEPKSWVLTGWKIVDLFDLRVSLKPEYNADNLAIYRNELILLEGDGTRIF